MPSARMSIKTDTFSAALKRWPGREKEVTRRSLREFGEQLMGDIKENDVPVEFGALRDSGRVTETRSAAGRFAGGTAIELSFGGAAAGYAVYVHERTELRHPHGRAKYLEAPLAAAAPQMGDWMARRAYRVFK